MSMIFYIFLYRLTGYFVPYLPDKISIFPELSSPQFLLYPWMPPENFLRTYTLTVSPTEYLGGMLANMCT